MPLPVSHTTNQPPDPDCHWGLLLQAMVAAPQGFNISHMLQPGLSVLVSMGLGSVGGAALGAVLNAKPAATPRALTVLGRIVPQPVIARYLKGLYALRP